MRFDTTIDFGRSVSWWPVSAVVGGSRSRGARRILALWGGATVLSVSLALVEAKLNWSGIPIDAGPFTMGFTFYPPVMIGILLTLWLGPSFGAATAYVSTLASGLYAGLSIPRASFFALGSPIELLLLWFLLLILRVQPDLPRLQDWGLFASAGLIAATASSVDIMLYNAAHRTALLEGQRLWLGWILGDFFQMMVLVAPLLWIYGKQAQAAVREAVGLPPRRELSTGRVLLLLLSVWATLGLLVLLGVQLLAQALDIPDFAVTVSGDPLVPRLREMGLFVGVFVVVLLITTMALTAALAGVGDQHRERSLRDDLTGCFNRRAFKRLFAREAERSAGLNLPMSLVFFDIDHFKSLNDRHGHSTGDTVLVSVARQTTEILSAQELFFRWGGEEFLVLLSHTGREEARQFAERLRARIEEKVGVEGGPEEERITISLGVASGEPPDFDEIGLIRNADAALYQAKASGRNRVVTDAMMRGGSGPL
jgi:diguanylate cyclase (GGDEF)-like protein